MSAPLGMWLKGFGEDANGEIYVMASRNLGPSGNTGVVFEIVPEPSAMAVSIFPKQSELTALSSGGIGVRFLIVAPFDS